MTKKSAESRVCFATIRAQSRKQQQRLEKWPEHLQPPWTPRPEREGCCVARAQQIVREPTRLHLSGSWQQGHSAAHNTPFLIHDCCAGRDISRL